MLYRVVKDDKTPPLFSGQFVLQMTVKDTKRLSLTVDKYGGTGARLICTGTEPYLY